LIFPVIPQALALVRDSISLPAHRPAYIRSAVTLVDAHWWVVQMISDITRRCDAGRDVGAIGDAFAL
jgi:hypothetical protein